MIHAKKMYGLTLEQADAEELEQRAKEVGARSNHAFLKQLVLDALRTAKEEKEREQVNSRKRNK
jgi:hypothetical protein